MQSENHSTEHVESTQPLAQALQFAMRAVRIAERIQRGQDVTPSCTTDRVRARLASYAERGVAEDEAHRRNLRGLREDVEHLERAMAVSGAPPAAAAPRPVLRATPRPRARRRFRSRRVVGTRSRAPVPSASGGSEPPPSAAGDEQRNAVCLNCGSTRHFERARAAGSLPHHCIEQLAGVMIARLVTRGT
jgi:hypothetical protein